MFEKWFLVSDKRAVTVLLDLCSAISNNNDDIKLVPNHVKIVRERMIKFLFNALAYNVHYKDLGHMNLEHMTNFFMYPMTNSSQLYPFYTNLFENTLSINGGYLQHCKKLVIDAGISGNPFVTRRDFDLTLLYFILTGKIKLTVEACRSYLFKGSFNPLADVFKCFVMVLKMTTELPMRILGGQWTTDDKGECFMSAPLNQLSKRAIKIGLTYCGDNILFWTPNKIRAITEFATTTNIRIQTKKVPVETLISENKGMYLIDSSCGLVINVSDCHPYVYVWTSNGLFRYDSPIEYLYSDKGIKQNTIVKKLI